MRSSTWAISVAACLVACGQVDVELSSNHGQPAGGGTGPEVEGAADPAPADASGRLDAAGGEGWSLVGEQPGNSNAGGEGGDSSGGSSAVGAGGAGDMAQAGGTGAQNPGGAGAGPVATETAGSGGVGGQSAFELQLGAGDLTLLLVFDKSGSMSDGWDERSKWDVANEALMNAIEPYIDNLTIGAIMFPQPGGCDVAPVESELQMDYAPGRRFVSHWQETTGSRAPGGLTPLELAFEYADAAIKRGGELGLLDDRFRVVLLTDGEPTCNDDTSRLVSFVAEWSQLGVETWVMGLPGSEGAANLLNEIARAGGTVEFWNMGSPTALEEGLTVACG